MSDEPTITNTSADPAPAPAFDPDQILKQAKDELTTINGQIEMAKAAKLNAENRIRDLSQKRDKTQKILNAMTPRAPRTRVAKEPKAAASSAPAKKAAVPAVKAASK